MRPCHVRCVATQPNLNHMHYYQYIVGLTLAYSNPNPQLDGLLDRLSGPLPARTENPGPSWTDTSDTDLEVSYGQPPRSLDKRFSPETRAALAAAFTSGAKQKDLAREYGISIRSVKRLIHQARTARII